MKILVVASYNKGYFAPFIVEQVEALRRVGLELDYFGVEGKGIKGYLNNLKALKAKIKSFQPDVIHAHYGLCGLLANFQIHVPVVTTFHGSDINDPKVLPWSRLAMYLSAYNFFVSPKLIDIVKPRRKYSLLPCGINLEDYPIISKENARMQMKLDKRRKYILFAGAFDNPVKNYPLAKKSVELLNEDVMLLELKGYSRSDVAMLMNAADVFLLTSFSEGSPQVIKEALACGCPIVSVDVGDVKGMITSISGNYLSTTFDAREIAGLLIQALSDCQRTEGRKMLEKRGLLNSQIVRNIIAAYNYAAH